MSGHTVQLIRHESFHVLYILIVQNAGCSLYSCIRSSSYRNAEHHAWWLLLPSKISPSLFHSSIPTHSFRRVIALHHPMLSPKLSRPRQKQCGSLGFRDPVLFQYAFAISRRHISSISSVKRDLPGPTTITTAS